MSALTTFKHTQSSTAMQALMWGSVSPTAMHLPAECYSVRLELMNFVLATCSLLHSVLGLPLVSSA